MLHYSCVNIKNYSRRLLHNFEDYEDRDLEREFLYLNLLADLLGLNCFDDYLQEWFQGCSRMLREVRSSRRTDALIRNDVTLDQMDHIPISCLAVTNKFLPDGGEDQPYQLRIPDEFQDYLNKYAAAYARLNPKRSLKWDHNISIVELKDGMNGTFLVTPATAVLILALQSQPTCTLNQLSHKTGLPPYVVKEKIRYWTCRGIVVETEDETYSLI